MNLEELKTWLNEFRSNWKRASLYLCIVVGVLIFVVYISSYISEKAKEHAIPEKFEKSITEMKSKQDERNKKPAKEKPSALHEYFKQDFSKYLAVNRSLGIRIFINQPEPENKQDYELEFRLHCDFESLTKFLSVFLPSSIFPNAAIICNVIAEQSSEITNKLSEGVIVTGSRFDDRMTEINELKFTGRVYIYHEAYLSNDEVDELRYFFKNKNLDPRFRGSSYLVKRHLYDKNESDDKM